MREISLHTVRPERVLLKALLLFGALNVLFAFIHPPLTAFVWRRDASRLPVIVEPASPSDAFSKNGFQRTYITDLDLLFRSHIISARPASDNEYRVVLIGDSSVWGVSLFPHETMAAVINAMNLKTCTGQHIAVYNLGYEFGSAPKDMIILSKALAYDPDLVVWFFSLVGFTHRRERLFFVTENKGKQTAAETESTETPRDVPPSLQVFWQRTIIGRRQELSRIVRLNLSQWMLSILGTDVPDLREPRPRASGKYSSDDPAFFGIQPPARLSAYASFDVLNTAEAISQQVKMVYINEPIGRGQLSGVRYNSYYPRWAYDQYRERMAAIAAEKNWIYYDLWDYLPPTDFSDTPFHHTPQGEQRLAQKIAEIILAQSCRQP